MYYGKCRNAMRELFRIKIYLLERVINREREREEEKD